MKKLNGLTKKIILFSLISSLVLVLSAACKKNVSASDQASATLSGNNYLKHIGFSSKVDNFSFSPATKSYSVRLVNEDVDKISLTAFAQDEKAKMSISPSGEVEIAAKSSVKFTITCTAQNGNVREVKVEVRRGVNGGVSFSNNAFLKSVRFSSGTLLQDFNSKKLEGYTVLLSSTEGATRILSVPEDENATIVYTPSSKIEVSEGGAQECTVTCTAQDGKTKKTYKFNIKRESFNEKPSLLEIVVGKGESLSPAFTSDHLTYSCLLPNKVASISVKGIPLNKTANVQVSPSGDVALLPNEEKRFTIKVSIPSKPTEITTYTIKVKRDDTKDEVATLNDLTIKGEDGTPFALSPAFSSAVKSYGVNIYKNFDGVLNLMGTPTSAHATTRVFLLPSTLGAEVGATMQLKCVVTAQAGNTETYTVVATRVNDENLSQDAVLKSLMIRGEKGELIELSPAFDSATVAYTAEVPFNFKGKIKVLPKAKHKKATVSFKIEPEELAEKSNANQTITVTVTAEDTSVKKDYVITVRRAAASNDADLKELYLKRDTESEYVTLNPEFDPAITAYTAVVPRKTRTVNFVWKKKVPTSSTDPEYPMAPVSYTPGTQDRPFELKITVTAQSGAKKTYTVKIASPEYEDKVNMVTVINAQTTVIGSGNEGAFIQGRTVTIAPYKMSEIEVPYITFMEVVKWGKTHGFTLPDSLGVSPGSTPDGDEEEPVASLKWSLAVLWCNVYSKMQGKDMCYTRADGTTPLMDIAEVDQTIKMDMEKNGYRLPTEVEWEFAARGAHPEDATWHYKWAGVTGNSSKAADVAKIGEFVWHWGNVLDGSNHKTRKPKLKKPTNYGKGDGFPKIYDMSGNVAEWVWDKSGNITKDTPVTGNLEGDKRFTRGGFCFNLLPQGKTEEAKISNELDRCMVTKRSAYLGYKGMTKEAGLRLVCKN